MTAPHSPRRRGPRTAALAGALALVGAAAFAQAWPTRPAWLVVGFAPGGAGIFAVHVPYRGSAPVLQDVMASRWPTCHARAT